MIVSVSIIHLHSVAEIFLHAGLNPCKFCSFCSLDWQATICYVVPLAFFGICKGKPANFKLQLIYH